MKRAAVNVGRAARLRSIPGQGKALQDLNAFITHLPSTRYEEQFQSEDADSLKNAYIAIKDNICTKDLPTTCGSRVLRDYVSPYDAAVVSQLRDAGVVIIGKTNLDEFGMG